jgi:hypothetical protein
MSEDIYEPDPYWYQIGSADWRALEPDYLAWVAQLKAHGRLDPEAEHAPDELVVSEFHPAAMRRHMEKKWIANGSPPWSCHAPEGYWQEWKGANLYHPELARFERLFREDHGLPLANGGDIEPPAERDPPDVEIDDRVAHADDDHDTATGWGSPAPPEEPWPEMDSEAFYGLAGEITDAIAPLTEADPVAILAQSLAAFGSVFGRGAYCRVGNTRHYPHLYQIIAGDTAKSRKGTSYDPVEDEFRLADPSWADDRVHSGLSSGEGVIHHVHDGIWVSEKISHGRGQKPTYERVLKEQPVTDKRLFIIEQEFASVLTVMRRQGNTLASVLRLGWDSRKLQTLTKHNAETATGAHVSVIGHITIEELRFLLDRVAIANGLANRFLILLAKRSNLLPFPECLDPIIAQGFADRIKTLLTTMDWRRAEVLFSAAARELWIAEYPSLSAPQPGLYGFAIGRAEAQTLRLAMIYALLDMTYTIEPVHLRAALAFWRYCAASAKYVLGDYLGEPVADDLLRALRQAGTDGMTRWDIYDLLGRNKSSEAIGAALMLLLRHDKARRRTRKAQGRGRPTEVWFAA